MADATLLNLVLYLPLIGIALIVAVSARNEDHVRQVSLAAMLVQFVLAAYLYVRFDAATPDLQFETRIAWISDWGVYYHIGLDGMNLLLVMLTAFLGPLVVAGAFTAIHKDVKLFYAMVFFIQFTMLGAFLAQDLFLFYLFWEAMMIPMFLIIGIWGGERRIYATLKFVLYTAFGSILMLAAVIYLVYSLYQSTGVTSFAFTDLYRTRLPLSVQALLLAAFALSFAIKVPIVPLHTWLPDAHVEAPTAGSVILAGVLLKMGTYGFLKLGFPLFPDATHVFAPVIMTLAVASIIYGACLALVQTDIKKIIAYSSISHLGYVMLGLISLDLLGIQGAIIQMVSHGLTAAGLFLMVGMIYERCHSRDLAAYGGLAKVLPVYSVFFMILTLASIGLPTTSGFTGEFLVLLGAFGASWGAYQHGATYPLVLAVSAVGGVVLGALYMLWFAQRFLYGATKTPQQWAIADLDFREKAILATIVVAVFALGLYPQEPLAKTEWAAREYQQLVSTARAPSPAIAAQADSVRAPLAAVDDTTGNAR
jgi:NADH-quinone oxidoreductase subunit M